MNCCAELCADNASSYRQIGNGLSRTPAPTQFDKQISSGTTTSSPIFYSKNFFHCNISVKNIHLYYGGRQGGIRLDKKGRKKARRTCGERRYGRLFLSSMERYIRSFIITPSLICKMPRTPPMQCRTLCWTAI